MGASDLRIMKFFVESLRLLCPLNYENFYCDLRLRVDQNKESLKKYWSKNLKIPKNNFLGTFLTKEQLVRKLTKVYVWLESGRLKYVEN